MTTASMADLRAAARRWRSPIDTIDLRLVPAAVVGWAVCWLVPLGRWPTVVVMVAVTAIPFAITIGLAFTNYNLIHYDEWRFIGLDNFAELARDRQTPIILGNTVVLVIATTLIPTVLGLGLAVLMERSIRGMASSGRCSSCPS